MGKSFKALIFACSTVFGSALVLPELCSANQRFISLKGEAQQGVFGSASSGYCFDCFFGLSLGYGSNIIVSERYFGFAEISLKLRHNSGDDFSVTSPVGTPLGTNSAPGSIDRSLEKVTVYLAGLSYGYEFMRHRPLSFGLSTTHSFGFSNHGQPAIGNDVGGFGKFKKDRIAVLLETGINHYNPLKKIAYERIGWYSRLALQFRL